MMASPLKVGLAGLGTVGTAVLRLIGEPHGAFAARCGRPVEVVAVSARDRHRDRGVDLTRMRWFDDAVEMAADPEIDVLVELIGGAGDPAK
jgi:homoserine dehydrogenase